MAKSPASTRMPWSCIFRLLADLLSRRILALSRDPSFHKAINPRKTAGCWEKKDAFQKKHGGRIPRSSSCLKALDSSAPGGSEAHLASAPRSSEAAVRQRTVIVLGAATGGRRCARCDFLGSTRDKLENWGVVLGRPSLRVYPFCGRLEGFEAKKKRGRPEFVSSPSLRQSQVTFF